VPLSPLLSGFIPINKENEMELPRKVWVLLPSYKPKEIEVETFKTSGI